MAENLRKLVHAAALLVPLLAELTSTTVVLSALGLVTGLYVLEEYLRLKGKRLPLITSFTLKMSTPNEKTQFISRPAYLALGVILALLIFPKHLAYASIAIVAVGDPVAAYVGERFGHWRIGHKSLEGFAAGLGAAFLATMFLFSPVVSFVGSTVGMLFELFAGIDDNLTMPLGAGAAMTLMSILWPQIAI